MSTILYRNAMLLLNGAELTGALHELAIEYAAEMLDETTFGDDTRISKAGLFTGKISGAGWFDGAVGVESVLFSVTGVDDTIIAVFPDGVTEGSATTGRGFAMKGDLSTFNMGGSVGQLLDVKFEAASRGIEA
jgi:hypothetical protein